MRYNIFRGKNMANESSTERGRIFRERMYAAGYKIRIIWVKKEKSKADIKITRRDFLGRLGELTEGMTDGELSVLYGKMLASVKEKQEAKPKTKKKQTVKSKK
jgi:hypothetical protein